MKRIDSATTEGKERGDGKEVGEGGGGKKGETNQKQKNKKETE